MPAILITEDSPLYGAAKEEAEEHENKFVGAWIPYQIWEMPSSTRENPDSGLSWMEKCLWAEISMLSKTNACWASNSYLGKVMGVSAMAISNSVSKMDKLGLLKYRVKDFNKREIYLSDLNGGFHHMMEGVPSRCGGGFHHVVDIVSNSVNKENNTPTPLIPKPKKTFITPRQSEIARIRHRISRMMGRGTNTRWDAKEEKILAAIQNPTEEEWAALEAYYSHKGEEGYYCRKNIIALLNNWAAEIDKAMAGKSKPYSTANFEWPKLS